MNRAELKAKAKEQIKGKIGILFLITLIIGAITGVVSGFIPVVGAIAVAVVTPAFSLSLIRGSHCGKRSGCKGYLQWL